jgi:hypothetical protein
LKLKKNGAFNIFYGYIIVLVSFSITIVMGGTMYSFGVFLNPMMNELGWTRAETSGAYSIFMLLHGHACMHRFS